jgi:YhcH/YjgK/YiaL family protein
MAIFGKFSTVRLQLQADERFYSALTYVEQALQASSEAGRRIAGIEVGKTERIDLAAGSFALEQVYVPKLRPDGFFESHRKYIDVQVIVAGEELMEVQDISRLVVSEPYLAERDFIKYADGTDPSVLKMVAGDVAVFFPEDGHMPSLRWRNPELVRKTVVKVPVSAFS